MPTQTIIKGLEHHAVFLFLVQLALLLATTRVLGETMRKLGQPPVVGELAAGVLLGPSVLGLAWPELQSAVFPRLQSQNDLISIVAFVGVLCLLIVTGLETDVALIRAKGRSAVLISAGGILTPFLTGAAMGMLLPDRFLVNPELRIVFALFMAVAMSISAVPVIAKVLFDLKLMRRDIGQLVLAAAMADDTVGWILLAVVAGLATRGSVDIRSVAVSVSTALLFLMLAMTIGGKIVDWILVAVDETAGGNASQLSAILVLAFAAAAFTQEMGIEAVLGAFVTGILVGQARRFRADVRHALQMVTDGFVAPVFFAAAGLKVDVVSMLDSKVLIVGAIVLSIACLGKVAGCYLGAWAGKLPHWERLAIGAGMNARGGMGIVVATLGLSLRVLTPEMYSVIIGVAIATSLMAPPLLRWTLAHVQMRPEEAARLESEALAATSFVRSLRRILLIANDAEQAELAGGFVAHLRKEQRTEITAFYAETELVPAHWSRLLFSRPRGAYLAFRSKVVAVRQALRRILGGGSTIKVAAGTDAIDRVLKEAAHGYDLIVMAVGQTVGEEGLLFGRVIDRVIREAPCATLVLRGVEPNRSHMRRILVPTIGTDYSKNALEAASVLARSARASLTVLHVVEGSSASPPERDRDIAHEVVEHQADVARKFGAEVEAMVVDGPSPESAILQLVERERYDLIMMGTSLRAIRQRAFFGHRAEALLKSAPCSVAVMSTP
jgi:Kef-type K+ transport system membrane component KefB/nucleotide-binding universal stress UspA family protein